jgi:hypothetical protein
MRIIGLENITGQDLARELDRGAKFVVYRYAVSICVMTFYNSTDIYFVRGGESRVLKSLPFTLLSLLIGWWGIPFGLVFTPMALFTNLGGGEDVTDQVVAALQADASPGYEA